MDAMSSLLLCCKETLDKTAKQLTQQVPHLCVLLCVSFLLLSRSKSRDLHLFCCFQLSEQQLAVEKVTSDNLAQMEKQRSLVDEYCKRHVADVDSQITTNKVSVTPTPPNQAVRNLGVARRDVR